MYQTPLSNALISKGQKQLKTYFKSHETGSLVEICPLTSRDVDGKLYVKERIELAQKQASFWQDYKFVNPVTKKVEPKEMYCERLDNTAVCAGIYKS